MVYDNLFMVYNYKVHVYIRSNEIICCSLSALGAQNPKYVCLFISFPDQCLCASESGLRKSVNVTATPQTVHTRTGLTCSVETFVGVGRLPCWLTVMCCRKILVSCYMYCTHKDTRTHTHTHKHTYACTHTNTPTHTHTQTDTHPHYLFAVRVYTDCTGALIKDTKLRLMIEQPCHLWEGSGVSGWREQKQ